MPQRPLRLGTETTPYFETDYTQNYTRPPQEAIAEGLAHAAKGSANEADCRSSSGTSFGYEAADWTTDTRTHYVAYEAKDFVKKVSKEAAIPQIGASKLGCDDFVFDGRETDYRTTMLNPGQAALVVRPPKTRCVRVCL